jgi:hypothetical protein
VSAKQVWAQRQLPLRHDRQGQKDLRELQELVVPNTQRVQQNQRLRAGQGLREGWGLLRAQESPPLRSEVLATLLF